MVQFTYMAGATINRREFCLSTAAGLAAVVGMAPDLQAKGRAFKFRWVVASSMYGKLKLAEILPEVRKLGSVEIDIWPLNHGNQREQIEEMGHDAFDDMLSKHGVRLGILTHYDLGPFKLQKEMPVAKRFGARLLICGGSGPRGLKGDKLKGAVKAFVEKLKPHLVAAEKYGVAIGIENHKNNLIESPDSIKWLAEMARDRPLGVALAPYHLPQNPAALAGLIGTLGARMVHFYAWQYGMGCMKKLPKNQELLQMPGRGKLDFAPLVAALKKANYTGGTSAFMHPVPRGIPILPTTGEVTTEIARSQKYLRKCLAGI